MYYMGYEEFLGWLYWEEGFIMWLRSRYMLFRQFVNMNVFVASDLFCSVASRSAYSSAWRMFGHLGSPTTIFICNGPLYTPTPTMLTFPWAFGSVYELYV